MELSANTKAILLLTAPLIVGKNASPAKLLSPTEYGHLAKHLHEMQKQPADLVVAEAADLIHACEDVIPEERLRELLGRGFLLSQAVERWQARALWIVSRADARYPQKLKARLRANAPVLLYGCGPIDLLDHGDLAVVGSRDVDESLVDCTMRIGDLSARARRIIVCGGAKGIDQAAMNGALQGGGKAIGVLADSLEKAALRPEYRDHLKDERLVLISPYDPNIGFNVGYAMQRNKVIYGLAEAALVMSSAFNKGGTWAGATEQLDRLSLVPVYVRASEKPEDGLNALLRRGGVPWPDPQNVESFEKIFDVEKAYQPEEISRSTLETPPLSGPESKDSGLTSLERNDDNSVSVDLVLKPFDKDLSTLIPKENILLSIEAAPADALFMAVRQIFEKILEEPLKETDIASRLEISKAQVKLWLKRLLNEGTVIKSKKPTGYVTRQSRLFK